MDGEIDYKFIVDINVGKLAKWLRMMGYDTLLFKEQDDGQMIKIALREHRILLTRDSQLMKRNIITSGRVKAILIEHEEPKNQLKQVVQLLKLNYRHKPFSICLECNHRLIDRKKEELKGLVPPYVFKTQDFYMECPQCHRIFWRGTHWQAMNGELNNFTAKN